MTLVRTTIAAALLSLAPALATDAVALPFAAPSNATPFVATPWPAGVETIQYYGRPYGYHRPFRRHHLSNGTGYRGRGTATGGPVGSLPNRN